jgi:hypothetical protein
MFGSVFKMRPKAGKAAELRQVMMSNPRRPEGMITAYLLSEDANGDVWGMAVFEDEKTYRANAADPSQGEQYQKFRALLEADPEWHDGSIEQRPA